MENKKINKDKDTKINKNRNKKWFLVIRTLMKLTKIN
jgi:hypothetical protein